VKEWDNAVQVVGLAEGVLAEEQRMEKQVENCS
jgi:hypothetical protein